MSTKGIVFTAIAVTIIAIGAVYFVEVDQTQEAKLPDVDVEVEGGQAPAYDVETGSVEIGEAETKVTVPKVTLEEETVTVPTIEIEPAQESAASEAGNDGAETQSTN